MITAAQAIGRARDYHAAFNKQRNPDAVLLRFLSDYAAELYGRLIAIDESAVSTELVQPLPLADFEQGITIPANRYVGDVSAVTLDGFPLPVDLIPFSHRFDRQRGAGLYGWVLGSVLYLRGTAAEWQNYATVRVRYVPVPVPLVKLADAIALPDTALGACVLACVRMMSGRGHNDESLPAIPLALFMEEASGAEKAFLDDIANRKGAVKIRTRDTRGMR